MLAGLTRRKTAAVLNCVIDAVNAPDSGCQQPATMIPPRGESMTAQQGTTELRGAVGTPWRTVPLVVERESEA